MASPEVQHDTVLEAGSTRSRLARVYAEALLTAADRQKAVESTGEELKAFVAEVLDKDPAAEAFLSSPAVGRKVKSAALSAALPGRASDLMRGLFAVLT